MIDDKLFLQLIELTDKLFLQLIELTAAVLGFAYVFLIATNRSIGWFFGIASGSLYAYFFYRAETWGLFSQQIAYVILGFYGLMTWSSKKESLPIRFIGKTIAYWILGGILAGLVFNAIVTGSWGFRNLLDAQFFIFSLIATWLTTRKIIENWHIWIVVNVIGTIWFVYEHWWSTSALYLAYLILAINGLHKWKKEIYA